MIYFTKKGGSGLQREEREVCYDKDLEIEAYRFKGILQKFPNHFHEHYVIGFIESGKRHLSCKSQDYIVETGDILLFNPKDNHTCEPVDNQTLDYRCINIKTEVMEKVAKEITGETYLPHFTLTVGFHSEYLPLLQELHIAIMKEQPDFQKEEIFLFLMERLIEDYTLGRNQMEKDVLHADMKVVCDYIEEHCEERITLEDLSLLVNMNKYSLLRSFAKKMGITPYCYLETIRINKAKRLLEQGIGPIDTAIQTGFVDQSHFTNQFKGYIGLTPKQYQRIFIDVKGK